MKTFSKTFWVFLALALWTAPWFIFGLNYLGWTFAAIDLIIAAAELVSVLNTGKTLSQNFGVWGAKHSKSMYAVLGLVSLGYSLLVLHLLGSAEKRGAK